MVGRGLIQEAFEAQARRRPGALALDWGEGRLTYAELDQLAGLQASAIRAASVERQAVVAIAADRGPGLVVAMLACLKAGRPFVVFDTAYPASRLEVLAGICRPGLLLDATRSRSATLPRLSAPRLAIDLAAAGRQTAGLPADLSPDAPAYLLFTSGSTGEPKCVACSHRPLVNFIAWQAQTFGLGAEDRFTLLSGLSHDPVLRDVFTPLSLGASLHVPHQGELTAPGGLRSWFARVRPTAAHMTPPLGQLLLAGAGDQGPLPSLRHVFWGGDVLRQSLVDAMGEVAPGCESVNFYGSTETPQAAAFCRAPRGARSDRVPIGRGVDGFDIAVQAEGGGPARDEELGEIVIRSAFLTLGYVRDGRLPPAGLDGGEGLYATGDLGRRRADGVLVIEGRRDDQVKVRGFRVEMPEITACALSGPGIGAAVTLNIGDGDDVQVCCFVTPAGEWRTGVEEDLKGHFASRLPPYMSPSRIVVLDRLPLLPNGKVDRQALIAREREHRQAEALPETMLCPRARALTEQWRTIFRSRPVTASSSFASLGGDSLSYVNAYLSVEETLGAAPDGWTTMTVAELAAAGEGAAAKKGVFTRIESAILLRAAAISAVVASHFGLLLSGGGATSALIWISGFIFGGLQLHEAEHNRSPAPVLRVLRSILLPLAVYEAPQLLVKAVTGYHFHWSSVFLFVDLLDYRNTAPSGPDAYGGHEFVMWYIHCIIHILLLYAGLLALFTFVLKVRRPVAAAVVAALGLGLFSRFLMPVLFDPGFWTAPVRPMTFFNHSPTTHLATFALAAFAGYLRGRGRLAVMALAVAYAALSTPLFGPVDAGAIALVAGLLLFAPQIPAPRILSRPIYLVAGASLFIYLLHLKVFAVLTGKLHVAPLAAWPVAIAAGVAAWGAWNWAAPRVGRLLSGVRTRSAAWGRPRILKPA